jgi:hypothetical protein
MAAQATESDPAKARNERPKKRPSGTAAAHAASVRGRSPP